MNADFLKRARQSSQNRSKFAKSVYHQFKYTTPATYIAERRQVDEFGKVT
jgi:hypothetical protein